jgi:hypothetical protein
VIQTVCPLSPHSVSPVDRSAKGALFPPDTTDATERLWAHAIAELIARLLPRRRPRANPRVVKRKYTRWHVKRVRHREWPQPDRTAAEAILISN